MVVDKKFYERLKLFWWVFLGMNVYNFLESFLVKIAYKVLNDYQERGIEPSESKVRFVAFLAENNRILAYIGLAVYLIYFVTMLRLRKYSDGLLITAFLGIFVTVLSIIHTFFFWNKNANDPKVLILTYAVILGSLALSVLFAVSMLKLVKPYSEDITMLWKIYLWVVIADYVLRIIHAVLISIAAPRGEGMEKVLTAVNVIQTIYGYIIIPFEILCMALTVLMFKKKMQDENNIETGDLKWQN